MTLTNKLGIIALAFLATACVSKKKFLSMQTDMQKKMKFATNETEDCNKTLNETKQTLALCQKELSLRKEQVGDLKIQVKDQKNQSDKQLDQVGNLTVLSKSANDNIKETLAQLEKKDKYIHLLYAAKNKADSINLALAVNLKTVLKDGINDNDVEIKVDKTVVFINLSDKMLYKTGSSVLTSRANEVLEKIALIIADKPDLDVMIEGYTDNTPIKTKCIKDNWDLSVKRATSVVRVLQDKYNVNPNKLVAAGRGEYNTLASNETVEGRSKNRRTRVIILPKLNQFYDLLNPNLNK